jgi:hypothetical protein
MMECNDGKRVARTDEEALGAEDHVAVAIAITGSTLMAGYSQGEMESKSRSSCWGNGGKKVGKMEVRK